MFWVRPAHVTATVPCVVWVTLAGKNAASARRGVKRLSQLPLTSEGVDALEF